MDTFEFPFNDGDELRFMEDKTAGGFAIYSIERKTLEPEPAPEPENPPEPESIPEPEQETEKQPEPEIAAPLMYHKQSFDDLYNSSGNYTVGTVSGLPLNDWNVLGNNPRTLSITFFGGTGNLNLITYGVASTGQVVYLYARGNPNYIAFKGYNVDYYTNLTPPNKGTSTYQVFWSYDGSNSVIGLRDLTNNTEIGVHTYSTTSLNTASSDLSVDFILFGTASGGTMNWFGGTCPGQLSDFKMLSLIHISEPTRPY